MSFLILKVKKQNPKEGEINAQNQESVDNISSLTSTAHNSQNCIDNSVIIKQAHYAKACKKKRNRLVSKTSNQKKGSLLRKYRKIFRSKPRATMIKLINLLKSQLISTLNISTLFPEFSQAEIEVVCNYLNFKRIKKQFTPKEDELILSFFRKSDLRGYKRIFPGRCLRDIKHRYHFLSHKWTESTHTILNNLSTGLLNFGREAKITYPLNQQSYFNTLVLTQTLSRILNRLNSEMKEATFKFVSLNDSMNNEFAQNFNQLLELLIKKTEDNVKPFDECKFIVDKVKESFMTIESDCCGLLINILFKIERSYIRNMDCLSSTLLQYMNLMLKSKLIIVKTVIALVYSQVKSGKIEIKQ